MADTWLALATHLKDGDEVVFFGVEEAALWSVSAL